MAKKLSFPDGKQVFSNFPTVGTNAVCYVHKYLTMSTITKRDLVINTTDKLEQKGLKLRQQDVQLILQTLIEEIAESLTQGNNVAMRKFGVFEVREMKAKIGRNPKAPDDTIYIPARLGVKFKPSLEIKNRM